MTTTKPPPTIEDAVLALARRVDLRDGGFQGSDLEYGHRLAGRIALGQPLPDEHRRAAYRMLTRYVRHLREAGIELSQVTPPGAAPRAPMAKPIRGVIVRGDRIFTRTPIADKDRMGSMPGAAYHKTARCQQCNAKRGSTCRFPRLDGWHLPATPIGAINWHSTFETLGGYTADAGFRQLLELGLQGRAAGARRTADDLPAIPGLKTDAWLHQRQAYWFGAAQDGVLLDMEMGTGKSLVAVGLMVAKHAERPAGFGAIILCPDRVVGVWGKQFRIHAAAEWHVLDGRRENRNGETVFRPVAERVREFDHGLHECDCGRPHVVVANYAISIHEPFTTWALQQQWGATTFDEIHKLKTAGGKWSRWAARLTGHSRFRAGLTGTLMPHSPLDVFGPARALDPGLFGTSETKFKHRYAIMGGYQNKQVMGIQPDREGELTDLIARITYRVGDEVLDLPDEVPDVTLECTLSPQARRVYAAVEAEMYAEVARLLANGASAEDAITADNVLVQRLRLQQITGGAVRLDSGADVEIDTSKAELLEDVLEDIDPELPVVVFGKYHHDLDAIARTASKLNRAYAELSGRRDDALTRDSTLSEANRDGEPLRIAGVQIQAGGTGVDLTNSHHAIYYSLGYSLGDYLQSRKRLRRPGQNSAVRYIHLVASGTIDIGIYEALAARESVAKYLGALVQQRIDAGDAPRPPRGGVDLQLAAAADALTMFGLSSEGLLG